MCFENSISYRFHFLHKKSVSKFVLTLKQNNCANIYFVLKIPLRSTSLLLPLNYRYSFAVSNKWIWIYTNCFENFISFHLITYIVRELFVKLFEYCQLLQRVMYSDKLIFEIFTLFQKYHCVPRHVSSYTWSLDIYLYIFSITNDLNLK